MKAKEIREMTGAEMRQALDDTSRQIFDIKAKTGLGEPAEKPLKVRFLRRDRARIKTIERERELQKNG